MIRNIQILQKYASNLPGRRIFAGLLLILFLACCSSITHLIGKGLQKCFPGAIYVVDIDRRMVALTIDDGPDPRSTDEILQVLRQNNAQATFFLISDYVVQNPDVVRRIVADGNEIGNHLTADEPSYKLDSQAFAQKFHQADSILAGFQQPVWFRPGSGFYHQEMLAQVNNFPKPYRIALGSVYPYDVLHSSVLLSTAYIRLNVRKGSILILHDRGRRGLRTAETLSRILPELTCRGYRIVSLSGLVAAQSDSE